MNNYDVMRRSAAKRFLTYPPEKFTGRPGISRRGGVLQTCFIGRPVRISLESGEITLLREETWQQGSFEQCMCIYDWLCDRKENAMACGTFCTVSSLPGIYVRGSGLSMGGGVLAEKIDADGKKFREICLEMGGKPENLGDLAYRLQLFPDLPAMVKFYFSDGEFPPSLTLLWDRNTLDFLRYETVYYLASCLLEELRFRMEA